MVTGAEAPITHVNQSIVEGADQLALGALQREVGRSVSKILLPVQRGYLVTISLISGFILFFGAMTIGISWDERLQLEMTGNWKKYGLFQLVEAEGYAYGPVAAIYSHVITVLLGQEELGVASFAPEAYVARHVSVALLALLGALSVGFIAWYLSSSMTVALLGVTVMLSVPLWVGHGMFNPKDIAVATGYTLFTAGTLAMAGGASEQRLRFQFLGLVAFLCGVVLASGTRTTLLYVAIATLGLGIVLTVLIFKDVNALRRLARNSILAFSLSYLALIAVYPQLFLRPSRLLSALTTSAAYPWDHQMLMAGKMIDSVSPPWHYIPTWFAAQLPIFVHVMLWMGLIHFALRTALGKTAPAIPNRQRFLLGLGILLAQVLLLPLAAVLMNSTVYDGVRHFLFVVPALVALATVGSWLAIAEMKPIPNTLAKGAIAVGLLTTTIVQSQLFPYSYTYFNPVVTAVGVDGNWPTDYWRTSGRELIPKIPDKVLVACSEWRLGQDPEPCDRQHQYAPYWDTRGENTLVPSAGRSNAYLLVETNRGEPRPPSNCKLVDAVTRSPLGLQQTMSWIAECPLPG